MTLTVNNVAEFVRECIRTKTLIAFYTSALWRNIRAEVLKEQKYECQHCKSAGFYRKATEVHHVKKIRKYPALALSKWYTDEAGKRQRQLVALCATCHREADKTPINTITEERWD